MTDQLLKLDICEQDRSKEWNGSDFPRFVRNNYSMILSYGTLDSMEIQDGCTNSDVIGELCGEAAVAIRISGDAWRRWKKNMAVEDKYDGDSGGEKYDEAAMNKG